MTAYCDCPALFLPPMTISIVCLMRLWIPTSNYEKLDLVSVYVKLGRECFVTNVAIIMGEPPCPNACRHDGEILGTVSGGRGKNIHRKQRGHRAVLHSPKGPF